MSPEIDEGRFAIDWITTIWTGFISISMAMSAVYLIRWVRRREVVSLLLVLLGMTVAVQAITEIWMFRATTINEFGLALRWLHVPVFFATCLIIGILHLGYQTDRLWLGLAAGALRLVSLIANFASDPNLNFIEITSVQSVIVLGESIAYAEGTPNPWMITGQVAMFGMLVYIVDATIGAWRADRNLRTLILGGSMAALAVTGLLEGVLIFWGVWKMPIMAAPVFIGAAFVMAAEIGAQMLNAERLDEALRRSREQLENASRGAALSELSGSLAHEINQPLGVILSNAEAAEMMLRNDTPDTEELREIVGDIIDADHRAAEVIVRLRALLKRGEPTLTDTDMNDVVQEALGHLGTKLTSENVVLEKVLYPDLPVIAAERILLVQVIMNLLANARDSVLDIPAKERRVRVSTHVEDQNVVLEVSDNGPGFKDDPERLFQAFVTTKKTGMGMGLAISRSIVDSHGGRIRAEAIEPRGALFRVTIPRKCHNHDGQPDSVFAR